MLGPQFTLTTCNAQAVQCLQGSSFAKPTTLNSSNNNEELLTFTDLERVESESWVPAIGLQTSTSALNSDQGAYVSEQEPGNTNLLLHHNFTQATANVIMTKHHHKNSKPKLYESSDLSNPIVHRALLQKQYRDRIKEDKLELDKKLENMERALVTSKQEKRKWEQRSMGHEQKIRCLQEKMQEQNKEMALLKAELDKEKARNNALNLLETKKMVSNFACVVSLFQRTTSAPINLIVSQPIANKRACALKNDEVEEIYRNADNDELACTIRFDCDKEMRMTAKHE